MKKIRIEMFDRDVLKLCRMLDAVRQVLELKGELEEAEKTKKLYDIFSVELARQSSEKRISTITK